MEPDFVGEIPDISEDDEAALDLAEREREAAKFAEPVPTDQVALAGPDGRRAAELLGDAKRHGMLTLYYLTRRALKRLLASGNPADAESFFDEQELQALADSLANTTGTANLLGRARIRERAEQAELVEQGLREFGENDSFAAFGASIPVLSLDGVSRFAWKPYTNPKDGRSGAISDGGRVAYGPDAERYLAGQKEEPKKEEAASDKTGSAESVSGKQTTTPEFKAWFGDSKVVNPDGTPAIVYHGTKSEFDAFQPSKPGGGIYFTADPDVASSYSVRYGKSKIDGEFDKLRAKLESEGVGKWDVHRHPEWKALEDRARTEGASVAPVYLSIRNPLVIVNSQKESSRVNAIKDDPVEIAKLIAQGYDGIVVRGAIDRPISYTKADAEAANKPADLWVAFRPTQIKSAIGNKGTFDPKNPKITHSEFVEPPPPIPPESAINYFNSLVPTLNIDPAFVGIIRDRAFTMSVATDEALLRSVKSIIADTLKTGDTTGKVADIQDLLEQSGVAPKNPQYSEMVYRSNMMNSFNEGASEELQDPLMQEFFPVNEYLGIADGRERARHRVHFNKYYPANVPFAEIRDSEAGEYDGYNCRCTFRPVSKYEWRDLKARGATVEESW